jgi:hypothetical protein
LSAAQRSFAFVGHNAPVVAVRFNARMFHTLPRDTRPGAPSELCSAVAVGSQDCTVSVWVTSRPLPVVVLKHAFKNVRTRRRTQPHTGARPQAHVCLAR